MEINKNRWKVRIAVLAIFTIGFVSGVLSWNIYRSWSQGRYSEGRRDRYEQMLDRLQLTQEQRVQVDRILSDARTQLVGLRKQSEPAMREVRQQTDERLQAVLTPQQWEQFKQMRNEMRGRFRRGRGR